MMSKSIAIKQDGTVLLGQHISCDGFAFNRKVRVQTHIHKDHMSGFDTSKVNQDIIVSLGTRDLLIALYNVELPYKNNLIVLEQDKVYECGAEKVEIAGSNHMLGSVQTRVTLENGMSLGYSSDFFWPMKQVLEVDLLVIDSTYGSPELVREYNQQEVEERMVQLIFDRLRSGPVIVLGYVGRLQHCMNLVADEVKQPIIVTERVRRVAEVYSKYGYRMGNLITCDSVERKVLTNTGERYLAFMELTERRHHPWTDMMCKVTLSAYMVPHDEPIMDYGNGDFRVALTDHADFNGTMEYVIASKARDVIVHPCTGHPQALAESIRSRLGINATVPHVIESKGWG